VAGAGGGGGEVHRPDHQHDVGRRAVGELRPVQLRDGEGRDRRADADHQPGALQDGDHRQRRRAGRDDPPHRDLGGWHGVVRARRAGRGRVPPDGPGRQLAARRVAGQRRGPARHRPGDQGHSRQDLPDGRLDRGRDDQRRREAVGRHDARDADGDGHLPHQGSRAAVTGRRGRPSRRGIPRAGRDLWTRPKARG